MTRAEPRWTEQDRAEALALALHRAGLCECGCGHLRDDVTSPEKAGGWRAEQYGTCNARMEVLAAQRSAADQRGTDNAPARLFSVQWKG